MIAHSCVHWHSPFFGEAPNISYEWELSHLIFYSSIVLATAERLDVAASAVGLATTANLECPILSRTINNIKGISKIVEDVKVDL